MDSGKYGDIIDLPHHQSEKRAHMSMRDRAAQFAPFAALTGYENVISETGRLTDHKIELDETAKTAIADRLQLVLENVKGDPEVVITYFIPDKKKSGGRYVTSVGVIEKFDALRRIVTMSDSAVIPVDDIYSIECGAFNRLPDA